MPLANTQPQFRGGQMVSEKTSFAKTLHHEENNQKECQCNNGFSWAPTPTIIERTADTN